MKCSIFREFNRRRDLWDLFCSWPRVRMNTGYFSKRSRALHVGALKKKDVILTKHVQYVNEMMAVVVKMFKNC